MTLGASDLQNDRAAWPARSRSPLPWRRVAVAMAVLALLAAPGSASGQEQIRGGAAMGRAVTSAHFEIAFSRSDDEGYARRVARLLEAAYAEITARWGLYEPAFVKVFLYPNREALAASPIAHFDMADDAAGYTDPISKRIGLAMVDSERELRAAVRRELASVIGLEALYPGQTRTFDILKFPFYAEWLQRGIVESEVGALDTRARDLVLRDLARSGDFPALADLEGFEHLPGSRRAVALYYARAVIDFLKESRGETVVGRMVRRLGDYFLTRSFLRDILDTTPEHLDEEARAWIRKKFPPDGRPAIEPGWSRITPQARYPTGHLFPQPSPEGDALFFLSSRDGRRMVKAIHGREESEGRTVVATLDVKPRPIAFDRDGRAIFAARERGRVVLRSCPGHLWGGEWGDARGFPQYTALGAFDDVWGVSSDPRPAGGLYYAVTNGGRGDIQASNRVEPVTNDAFADRDPRPAPDSLTLYYRSERQGLWRLIARRLDSGAEETLPVCAGEVFSFDVAADGASLVVAGEPRPGDAPQALLYDVAAKRSRRISGVAAGVTHARFDPAGGLIVSVYADGRLATARVPATALLPTPTGAAGGEKPGAAAAPGTPLTDEQSQPTGGGWPGGDAGPDAPAGEEGAAGDVKAGEATHGARVDYFVPLLISNSARVADDEGRHTLDFDAFFGLSLRGSLTGGDGPAAQGGIGAVARYVYRGLPPDLGVEAFYVRGEDEDFEVGEGGGRPFLRAPLSPFTSFNADYILSWRRENDRLDPRFDDHLRKGGVDLGVVSRDLRRHEITVIGGDFLSLETTFIREWMGASRNYNQYGVKWGALWEVEDEHVVGLALRYRNGTPGSPRVGVGGMDGVRGFGLRDMRNRNFASGTFEYRFPLYRGADFGGALIYLKDFRGLLFGDAGFTGFRDRYWGTPRYLWKSARSR
ncbi:MAG: hypothetical protein HY719_09285, partial [Planctomycetes bacterium]|nr:hypothetical protein [Planctomycetota bacterium]